MIAVIVSSADELPVNVRFSGDRRRFPTVPRDVRIGGVCTVVFEEPDALVRGVGAPEWVVRLLVSSVPGFKRVRRKGVR